MSLPLLRQGRGSPEELQNKAAVSKPFSPEAQLQTGKEEHSSPPATSPGRGPGCVRGCPWPPSIPHPGGYDRVPRPGGSQAAPPGNTPARGGKKSRLHFPQQLTNRSEKSMSRSLTFLIFITVWVDLMQNIGKVHAREYQAC